MEAAVGSGLSPGVRVMSRHLVKASHPSTEPHVLAVSNIDLFYNSVQAFVVCVYPKPTTGDFNTVVAAFETHLPAFLNYFPQAAGRIVADPRSGIPEIQCYNQGAELIVGDAGVELGALDWGQSEASLKMMVVPFGQELALSLQLMSFTCGGFSLVWGLNNMVGDGSTAVLLMRTWSELVRSSGTSIISGGGGAPHHDRSSALGSLRPRVPPSYGSMVEGMYTRWDDEHEVNALTAEESFVERLYYVEERDIAMLRKEAAGGGGETGTGNATRVQAVSAYLWKALAGVVGASKLLAEEEEKRCRMLWWVDGRHRLSSPELRSSLRDYTGTMTTYVLADEAVGTVLAKPLAGVAAMVREAITSVDYDELYKQMVDWMEVHKHKAQPPKFSETPSFGLGSPTLGQTIWVSFPGDTDFGFGTAALAVPVHHNLGRFCMGFLGISAKPADPGTWILTAFIWPRLAAALEADDRRIFKPLTAEYLGLTRATTTSRL
uniref:Uncharacterized protein n=1 Tax=Avena sativa TaxID=4498 RepID=A0ACD6A8R2_AVESA